MWAFEGSYQCRACGAQPTLPAVDLSFFYGHYLGLTPSGEGVIGDMFSDGGALNTVSAFVKSGVAAGQLPPDSLERSLHFWILEEAIDRAPTGSPYHCVARACPSCEQRALQLIDINTATHLIDPIPVARHLHWATLDPNLQSARLSGAADRAIADPWFRARPLYTG